mmetsp:Transcript_42119/g.103857  ORF Transcript_42119/g.103857 Transcript_42119/m.103857 type:complete len:292 (-) Transcript_42119:1055-1930(-)
MPPLRPPATRPPPKLAPPSRALTNAFASELVPTPRPADIEAADTVGGGCRGGVLVTEVDAEAEAEAAPAVLSPEFAKPEPPPSLSLFPPLLFPMLPFSKLLKLSNPVTAIEVLVALSGPMDRLERPAPPRAAGGGAENPAAAFRRAASSTGGSGASRMTTLILGLISAPSSPSLSRPPPPPLSPPPSPRGSSAPPDPAASPVFTLPPEGQASSISLLSSMHPSSSPALSTPTVDTICGGGGGCVVRRGGAGLSALAGVNAPSPDSKGCTCPCKALRVSSSTSLIAVCKTIK